MVKESALEEVPDATMPNSSKNQRALSLQEEHLLKSSSQDSDHKLGTTDEESEEKELEEIFEPRPSTSNSPCRMAGKRSMSLAVESSDRRHPPLALLPRTNQYEKHPLLQDRSAEGLSELEMFLMEKEQAVQDKRQPREALVPRGAHYETHALLVKKTSGLTELEQYLMEKEEEILNEQQRRHSEGDHRQKRLEPRSSQYQASALLESRDESGLSPIDHLLLDKVEELDKGKCSARCTCKNAHCPNCRSEGAGSTPSTPPSPEVDTVSRIEPKTSSKHVHFTGEGHPPVAAAVEEAAPKNNTDRFWKLGSGRKKKNKHGEGEDTKTVGNDVKQQQQVTKKSNASSHKHSCAIS